MKGTILMIKSDVKSTLPEDKEALVIDNLKLVPYVLNKYMRKSRNESDYEDYYQEGCIGLIKAAHRFDPTLGFTFATYAINLIMNEMRRYKRDHSVSLKISRSILVLVPEYKKLESRGVTKEDIIKTLGIDSDTYYGIANVLLMSSLNEEARMSKESNQTIEVQDTISDTTDEYSDLIFDLDFENALPDILKEFNEPHLSLCQEFLYTRKFGEVLSQEYFAKKYHTSQAQVSRVLAKLKKLILERLELSL